MKLFGRDDNYWQHPSAPAQQSGSPAQQQRGTEIESWLGGKFLGVVAAMLVLSGLVLLGVAFIPQLGNEVKAAFMGLFSLALCASGTVVTLRKRSAFSAALLACGLIAGFVSIFATHYHFGLVSHSSMLAAVGLWMAATLVLLALTRLWPAIFALLALAGIVGVPLLEDPNIALSNVQPDAGAHVLPLIMVFAYVAALGVLGIHLGSKEAPEADETAARPHLKALAILFCAEAALLAAAGGSAWDHAAMLALALMGAVLVLLSYIKLPAVLAQPSAALRVNDLAILGLGALAFLIEGLFGHRIGNADIVLAGIFAMEAVVVLGARAVGHAKTGNPRLSPAFPVLYAAASTGVMLGYLGDMTGAISSPYLWSAACMACALLAIAAGFWFAEKPLRLYGLTVTLLCVGKIALIDLNGEPLTRALALVAGGLVCFGISALYSYAAKRLA